MQVLKLGGSVITRKFEYLEADEKNIEMLARMLAEVWDPKMKLILVHGAGSFGHAPVIAHGITSGVKTKKQMLGFADTHSSCTYLSNIVVDRLIKNGIPAITIPPAIIIKQRKGRIVKFETGIINDYLKAGYLPVLHGDMVLDSALGGSVCSGDQIAAYLGKKAQRITIGTDVDGVIMDGKLVEKITKENWKKVRKYLKESDAPDVTGGMLGKVEELIKIKKRSYIVNALKPKRIADLLRGKKTICTEIYIK
jgi:isopentenyl phosphate kinase